MDPLKAGGTIYPEKCMLWGYIGLSILASYLTTVGLNVASYKLSILKLLQQLLAFCQGTGYLQFTTHWVLNFILFILNTSLSSVKSFEWELCIPILSPLDLSSFQACMTPCLCVISLRYPNEDDIS